MNALTYLDIAPFVSKFSQIFKVHIKISGRRLVLTENLLLPPESNELRMENRHSLLHLIFKHLNQSTDDFTGLKNIPK